MMSKGTYQGPVLENICLKKVPSSYCCTGYKQFLNGQEQANIEVGHSFVQAPLVSLQIYFIYLKTWCIFFRTVPNSLDYDTLFHKIWNLKLFGSQGMVISDHTEGV